MAKVVLKTFEREQLPLVEPWFHDADTQRWLGGPEWPREMLDLTDLPLGTFRGKTQTDRHRWLAWQGRCPVGYIDCGTFDRFTEWEGGENGRGVIDTLPLPTASLGYVIRPELRHQGYGAAMLDIVTRAPELHEIRLFVAGVDRRNAASIGCLLKAGYQPLNDQPDWEGMVYYARLRTARDATNGYSSSS
ncbi:GNAT family N-acetyltransferase [Actinopolymorpha pittospori]|uniref:RimJ/RimL family protein N-acetyltransferase n=1 Tax=Actinopolymorpha pittospori TaxID=648752 RepID=A0A927MZ52_9ACTN|nr:GNAT family N-acetyltransferase [Actinopolymorpha pittospori]MBE1605815.1 RimJ/RimL family protein N-acetyltransferase [Actinopolymorpha pittospori]